MRRMLSVLAVVAVAALSIPALAQSDVNVRGYYRSDGTYVRGHYRTRPNSTILDNYSTYPNVNPYTGRRGTVRPYQSYQPRIYTPRIYTPRIYTPRIYTPRGYRYRYKRRY